MARKSNDDTVALMVLVVALVGAAVAVLGFVSYLFVWLYKHIGSRHKQPPLVVIDADELVPSNEEFLRRGWVLRDWFNHENLVSAWCVLNGWDAARMQLHRVAYEITGSSCPDAQKEWFKGFMAQFAARDPLYLSTIDRVQAAVAERPGLLQSEIYKNRPDSDKETARYILYFAAELGDIRREKAGRSYRLYSSKAESLEELEDSRR